MKYSIKFNYRGSKEYERDFNINSVENGEISLDFDSLDSLKDHLDLLTPNDPGEYYFIKINGQDYIIGSAIPSISNNRLDYIINVRHENDKEEIDYSELFSGNI